MKWTCKACLKQGESKRPPKSRTCFKCWLEAQGLKAVVRDGVLDVVKEVE
jgi:hypothetical protein